MTTEALLSRRQLSERWRCSMRTIDRLREAGKLAWIDVSVHTRGHKPLVRFVFSDILAFENDRSRGGHATLDDLKSALVAEFVSMGASDDK